MFCLQVGEGGKLHVFMTSLPRNAGKHSLVARETSHGQEDPLTTLQPNSKSFLELAKTAAEYQVCSPRVIYLRHMAFVWHQSVQAPCLSARTCHQAYILGA